MPGAINDPVLTDVVYAEYARLHAVIDSTVNGSFTDFAMLAVLGSMFAWEPFSRHLLTKSKSDAEAARVLCIGFTMMFAVLAIIATRDLLKQSIIFFNAWETVPYEEALRSSLGNAGTGLFHSSEHFKSWVIGPYADLSKHFRGLVIAIAVFFPCFILWGRSKKELAIFVIIAVVLGSIYASALFRFADAAQLRVA